MTKDQIYQAFVDATDRLRAKKSHYSADGVLHYLRYETAIKGEGEFKINNSLSSEFARRYMQDHPDAEGFFELRKSKHDLKLNFDNTGQGVWV